MTLYGENLRLFIEDRVVAAALDATIHAAVTTEDATTKDSPRGWDELAVTGKSLDITANALVQVTDTIEFPLVCTGEINLSGTILASDLVLRHLNVGDSLDVECGEEIGICLVDKDISRYVAQSSYHETLHYIATEEVDVYICCYNAQLEPCHVTFRSSGYTPERFIELIKQSSSVRFSLCPTTGANNRDAEDDIVSGIAKVVDISLNAANKQRATYTVQLKATGEVSLPANETGISTLSLDEPEPEAEAEAEAGTEE